MLNCPLVYIYLVNKKAFVEASFNSNANEFSGKLLASTNSILSTDECVSLFISHDGLSHNSAYAAVSNDTSVNMLLNLKYLSDQKDVTVKQFSISVLSPLSFGPITLSKLKLHYNNSGDETTHNDVDKNSAILPVGSSLHLLAVVLQSSGSFGLKLSFDCNVKSKDLNVFTATIQPSSQKSLTLRSFLSLSGLVVPQLPESSTNSKPSTDGFLDLQLMKGSLTFEAAPFKMVAFEITTGLSSTGWALLNDPDISINDIYLGVSYTEEKGILATLFGYFLLGNLAIQVTGTKVDQV